MVASREDESQAEITEDAASRACNGVSQVNGCLESYFSYKNSELVCVRGLNTESRQKGIARFPFRGFGGAFSICAFKLLDGNAEKESETAAEKFSPKWELETTSQTSFFFGCGCGR